MWERSDDQSIEWNLIWKSMKQNFFFFTWQMPILVSWHKFLSSSWHDFILEAFSFKQHLTNFCPQKILWVKSFGPDWIKTRRKVLLWYQTNTITIEYSSTQQSQSEFLNTRRCYNDIKTSKLDLVLTTYKFFFEFI